jgi:DNA polymerase-1
VLESGKEGVRGHDLGQLALAPSRPCRRLPTRTCAAKAPARSAFNQVAVEQAAEYGAEDSDLCLRLHAQLHPQIEPTKALTRSTSEIEIPVRDILFRMERTGVLIDSDLLAQQSNELGKRLLELEAAGARSGRPAVQRQLAETAGRNPVRQARPAGQEENAVRHAVDRRGSALRTGARLPAAQAAARIAPAGQAQGHLHRQAAEDGQRATGRVHTSYAQAVAVTGRLASSDPNLQNIPVRTAEGAAHPRGLHRPARRHIVSADYSQIELRIMAHLSEDARLLEAFAQGEDVHRATAAEIFGVTPLEVGPDQRRVAKVINFGLIYGMSAFGLARQLDLERSRRAGLHRALFRALSRRRQIHGEHAQHGQDERLRRDRLRPPPVAARDPRRPGRPPPGRRTRGDQRADAGHRRRPDQAGDDRRAGLDRPRKTEDALVMQVHDELVLEVPDDELVRVRVELPPLMTQVAKLRVPLVVEVGVGANWDEAH